MKYLEYSKKILGAMEFSVHGLELNMRYDVMNLIIDNMNKMNLSQRDLAKKLKMKESQLSKIVSGEKNLTLKTIARFFHIFKKKPSIIEKQTISMGAVVAEEFTGSIVNVSTEDQIYSKS
jgi:transcriptional regulator with XRE-family HTH domain